MRLRRLLWQLLGRLQGKRRVCAWCPDFDRRHPKNANADHGMCPNCTAKERHKVKLEELRRRFPGYPEQIIQALAAGGVLAACAARAILEVQRAEDEENRFRKVVRQELEAALGKKEA